MIFNPAKSGNYGEGELKLADYIVEYFLEYLKGKGDKKPSQFYVTADGKDAIYWYCGSGSCRDSGTKSQAKECTVIIGRECIPFARKRTIKWKNGINPGKGKISQISSKLDLNGLKAKLTELGFYGNTTTTKKIEIKKRKYEASVTNSFSKEVYKWTSNKSLDDAKRQALDRCKIYEEKPELCGKVEKKITKKVEKKKEEKVVKKYSLEGKRSLALSWDGYSDLIAGTVEFYEADYKGILNLALPNNDGTCEGSYSLQADGKGTWQISCTNNMGAAGTLKWIKDGGVTGIGRDHNDKKVKFTVSKQS